MQGLGVEPDRLRHTGSRQNRGEFTFLILEDRSAVLGRRGERHVFELQQRRGPVVAARGENPGEARRGRAKTRLDRRLVLHAVLAGGRILGERVLQRLDFHPPRDLVSRFRRAEPHR